jgi:hypothetical protein
VHATTRYLSILCALAVANATSAHSQDAGIRKNQFSVDVGPLQGGLSYARRVGQGPLSFGGGVWGAWDPWGSFEGSVFQPMGVELFVRAHPARAVQLELGPSLLRYHWADDCSACTGTFAGVHAAAMVGHKIFYVGPTVRLGRVTGNPGGDETGVLWGIQARLLVSWGE